MAIELTGDEFGVFQLDDTNDAIEFDGEVFVFRNPLDETLASKAELQGVVDEYEHRVSDGQYISAAMQYIVKRLSGDVLSIPDPDNEDFPEDAVL